MAAGNICIPESASAATKRSQLYPEPLMFEPQGTHALSFIILHGRGSNAEQFGLTLLATELAHGRTLQEEMPNAKFIFPTASFRRSTVLRRIPITQWFNNFSLEDPEIKQDLQIEGLRETSQFIHKLVAKEVNTVGAQNVYFGGLSQGCAAMLILLALWTGPSLGGAFGMSGWLPLRSVLSQNLTSAPPTDDDVFFDSSDEAHQVGGESKLRPLFDELEIDFKDSNSFVETPIFLGHRCEDEKVAVGLGEKAADTLSSLGCDVRWQVTRTLGTGTTVLSCSKS